MMIPQTMDKDGNRLHSLATVLKANKIPQETINMILAAQCGLPMQKVDPKSPIFTWVDEPEAVEETTVTNATPEKPNPSTLAWDIVDILGTMDLAEGVKVLAMAANSFAGPHGYVARIGLNENVEVAGKEAA